MNIKQRPTQLDVARKAGVSRPTVSLALKGSSIVSEETRKHIRKIADEMGYCPDPMLSALSKYRNKGTHRSYQGTLAWVSHSPKKQPWNSITPYREYFLGASEHAKRLGYNIEQIDLEQQALSSQRLDSILTARSINGLLVCPPMKSGEDYELPWEKYSLITFGYTIKSPSLHRVSSSHYRATKTIFETLLKNGYKRIGFAFNSQVNLKTQEHCLAAYLCESKKAGMQDIPELVQDPLTADDFIQWHARYQPDAVIISSPLWDTLKESHLRFPQDLAVACPMVAKHNPELTGIIEKCREIGAAAVDALVQMIQQSKIGIPTDPQYILLEGKWNPGSTIRYK